ncbi:hypothetical protein GCM10008024_28600 [Allgaiera indica]|uniref:Uncharacterized protein n=1 Tax=Allgaiera indica TaxID=765699 RepID=A0AAN4UT37_9RHOB|nr:hypothetical protein GCM10008024_28600 [Allgaiera indica]
MLDGMALGLLVSRAAAGDVAADDVEAFLDHQFLVLKERSREHPVPVDARLAKAVAKDVFFLPVWRKASARSHLRLGFTLAHASRSCKKAPMVRALPEHFRSSQIDHCGHICDPARPPLG